MSSMKSVLIGIILGICLSGIFIYLARFQSEKIGTSAHEGINYSINKLTNQKQISMKKNNSIDNIEAPILTYHYIRIVPDANDALGFSLSVTPDDFRNQLALLTTKGYRAITLDDLYVALQNKKVLPEKPVILTFDDGYKDFYNTAFPILKEFNIKATVYIVSDFIDNPDGRYLSSNNILELDQSGLVTIGAHSKTHANLSAADLVKLKNEVYLSKKNIEKILRHKINHFCYPGGKWNDTVVSIVKAAGFQTATTTAGGINHTYDERLTLSRVRVSGGLSLGQFEERLAPVYHQKETKKELDNYNLK